ncbi:hypothetical protein PLIIFM63780_003383 [Purpureocillium lilacinum]|nr:hypothetical protein PLIIFM63780_003383 [Purpureocillium lilacinum]
MGKGKGARLAAEAHKAEFAFRESAGQVVAKSRDYFEGRPTIPKDPESAELAEILGPSEATYDNLWTADDEKELQDSLAAVQDAFATCSNAIHLAKLWKICISTMHCSPLAIMSPRHDMCFAQPSVEDRAMAEGATIARPFLEELEVLVCSPIWLGEPLALTAAIQLAVICRTGERRPWRIPCAAACRGVEQLKRRAKRAFTASLPETLEAIAGDMEARGFGLSLLFRLFRRIGASIEPESSAAAEDQDRAEKRVKYVATLGDLRDVRDAIDSLDTGTAAPLIFPTSLTAALATLYRPLCPPTAQEVAGFHKRSWLHERRMATRDTRQREQGGESGDSTSEPLDDSLSEAQGSRRSSEAAEPEVSLGDHDEPADVIAESPARSEQNSGPARGRRDQEEQDAVLSPRREADQGGVEPKEVPGEGAHVVPAPLPEADQSGVEPPKLPSEGADTVPTRREADQGGVEPDDGAAAETRRRQAKRGRSEPEEDETSPTRRRRTKRSRRDSPRAPTPAPEPDTEPAPEPDTEPAPEPDTEPAPEPDTEPAPEPEPTAAPAQAPAATPSKSLAEQISEHEAQWAAGPAVPPSWRTGQENRGVLFASGAIAARQTGELGVTSHKIPDALLPKPTHRLASERAAKHPSKVLQLYLDKSRR